RRIARHDLRDLRWVSIKDAHSGDFASVANRASHDQNSGGAERQVGALFEKTNGLASRACQELLHRVVRNLGQDRPINGRLPASISEGGHRLAKPMAPATRTSPAGKPSPGKLRHGWIS